MWQMYIYLYSMWKMYIYLSLYIYTYCRWISLSPPLSPSLSAYILSHTVYVKFIHTVDINIYYKCRYILYLQYVTDVCISLQYVDMNIYCKYRYSLHLQYVTDVYIPLQYVTDVYISIYLYIHILWRSLSFSLSLSLSVHLSHTLHIWYRYQTYLRFVIPTYTTHITQRLIQCYAVCVAVNCSVSSSGFIQSFPFLKPRVKWAWGKHKMGRQVVRLPDVGKRATCLYCAPGPQGWFQKCVASTKVGKRVLVEMVTEEGDCVPGWYSAVPQGPRRRARSRRAKHHQPNLAG